MKTRMSLSWSRLRKLLWLLPALPVVLLGAGYAAYKAQYWDDRRDVAAIPMPEADMLGESYRRLARAKRAQEVEVEHHDGRGVLPPPKLIAAGHDPTPMPM